MVSNAAFYVAFVLAFCQASFAALGSSSAGFYLRWLQAQAGSGALPTAGMANNTGAYGTNGTCQAMAELNEIQCLEVHPFNQTGTNAVLGNITRQYLPSESLIVTNASLMAAAFNVPPTQVVELKFNSSTPNGTVVSSGTTNFGKVIVPLNTLFKLPKSVPNLPLNVAFTHHAVLVRNSDSCSGSSSNNETSGNGNTSSNGTLGSVVASSNGSDSSGSVCDVGSVIGTVGVIATGNVSTAGVTIYVNTTQSNAGTFNFSFDGTGSQDQYCDTLKFESSFNKKLTINYQICTGKGRFACVHNTANLTVPDVTQTLANNLCYTPTSGNSGPSSGTNSTSSGSGGMTTGGTNSTSSGSGGMTTGTNGTTSGNGGMGSGTNGTTSGNGSMGSGSNDTTSGTHGTM